MAGRKLLAAQVPAPGPWLVRGKADLDASAEVAMLGFEPAREGLPGGFSHLIRQDQPFAPGNGPLHLATGIQRLADTTLMAAAPDLAEMLLRLLSAPDLTAADLDPRTRAMIDTAWTLLVRAAPHLEV